MSYPLIAANIKSLLTREEPRKQFTKHSNGCNSQAVECKSKAFQSSHSELDSKLSSFYCALWLGRIITGMDALVAQQN